MWRQWVLRASIALVVVCGVWKNLQWNSFGFRDLWPIEALIEKNLTDGSTPENFYSKNTRLPIFDIISVGSLKRTEYQKAQKETFGSHPSVRRFFQITEKDDFDQGPKQCTDLLTWNDVRAISGFCGGLRKEIQNKHRLLYDLKVKYAKPEWLQRTKTDPVAWICAQKRPMAGLWKALQAYNKTDPPELPDFLIIMDDDTYYNMEAVAQGLDSLQTQVLETQGDDSIVVSGCVVRGRLKRFKWTFPFGGWGTIFSKNALKSILEPLVCSNIAVDGEPDLEMSSRDSTSLSARFCPKLMKDRLGELQYFRDGMSLIDVMHTYVAKEPYVDHANWTLGFCLHSDWVWGYMVNYYNISVAMGRRNKDLIVDRLGAYNQSEINPPYSEAVLQLRRQCDFDSNQNCTQKAHMCHYVTPRHMRLLANSNG
ncbi:expressed unknown protein [Seminavis robusta]|uniref:Uncharacterized protein n=1 Tax=Seminavis robusta TaxID=568900 RepID=A0A9N8ECH8_9STRA|nr:expressed unknown protein [Seminavis robusta]|eukprot:Sro744_g196260.1 n/a (424) ;mRNA; r:42060-43418